MLVPATPAAFFSREIARRLWSGRLVMPAHASDDEGHDDGKAHRDEHEENEPGSRLRKGARARDLRRSHKRRERHVKATRARLRSPGSANHRVSHRRRMRRARDDKSHMSPPYVFVGRKDAPATCRISYGKAPCIHEKLTRVSSRFMTRHAGNALVSIRCRPHRITLIDLRKATTRDSHARVRPLEVAASPSRRATLRLFDAAISGRPAPRSLGTGDHCHRSGRSSGSCDRRRAC